MVLVDQILRQCARGNAPPDAIVHQMTAISVARAGKPDFKHMDRWFATV